jgi:L-malate glycosyltransferase
LKNVLMVCSLKAYKGINEFVNLAKINSNLNFEMVINETQMKIDKYFTSFNLSANLKIFPKQLNVHPFYQRADVVLNLTRVDLLNETFGLTVIEAMAYGLPVIVPTIGGIAELVQDGVNGFKVDSRNTTELNEKLTFILKPENYQMMSTAQLSLKASFDEPIFVQNNLNFISK